MALERYGSPQVQADTRFEKAVPDMAEKCAMIKKKLDEGQVIEGEAEQRTGNGRRIAGTWGRWDYKAEGGYVGQRGYADGSVGRDIRGKKYRTRAVYDRIGRLQGYGVSGGGVGLQDGV